MVQAELVLQAVDGRRGGRRGRIGERLAARTERKWEWESARARIDSVYVSIPFETYRT